MSDDTIIKSPVGDIHVKGKGSPVDTSVEYVPQNPFSIDIPGEDISQGIAWPGFPVEEKPGFIETAVEEFKEQSTNVRLLHAAENYANQQEKPSQMQQFFLPESSLYDKFIDRPIPDGWTPKQEIEKQTNIDPKYIPRLLDARSPQDFQYRLDDINQQMNHDRILENGSTFAKIIGGLVGLSPIGSIENFIPLAAILSKAKVGAGFVSATARNAPGMIAASVMREGAREMDKVDGNLPDFLKNTFVDAAFGTVFMGLLGGAKPFMNMIELEKIKDFSKQYLKGISYEFVVNAKGDLKGFRAVDISGGSVSASEVKKAQELADAAFYKGGLFKIPYVGTASLALLSGNIPGFRYVFGSPLIQLKTSRYKSANAFADAAFDHFITTEGEAKGGTRPPNFELMMKKTRVELTSLRMQTTALHAERNGYNITARPAIGIQNAWAAMKQKSIETLSKETKSTDYIAEDEFMDEVQRVLISEKQSEHSAVNKAADIYRELIDETYRNYRIAYNFPEDWLPPKTAAGYLMRVYDTKYLNENEGEWIQVVSKWLRESDDLITTRMKPITDLEASIKNAEERHQGLIRSTSDDAVIKKSSDELNAMKKRLRTEKNNLHDEIRDNPEYAIHADDMTALSHAEAKELDEILKPQNDLQKKIDEQKKIISDIRNEISKGKQSSIKGKTAETAKKHAGKQDAAKKKIADQETKLRELEEKYQAEYDRVQELAHTGNMNPRFYTKVPESFIYKFRDTNDRLKFRDVHESDFHREQSAKAYYNSIMNMHPEDIIADVFGRFTGNKSENPLKKRSLLIPDEILYENNFMTRNLYAKTANYVNFLARKTHLKNSFRDVTVNGGFEEIAESLLDEHKFNRDLINNRIEKLKNSGASEKEIAKEKKKLRKEKLDFEEIKKSMHTLFETRMMGLNKRGDTNEMARRTWMSLTSAANLHNLPATQIGDLAFGGFQHGIWPFVRDGVYPIISSLGGMLKTKDSEALRKMAPHVNLGYQDMLNNYADRNWHSELQPYLNMGKIESGVAKFAHFSSLTDLSPYIDNGLQHAHGSVIQSRFMELLHDQIEGKLSKKDSLYLRKYGIDPKKWADRMVASYKEAQGFKTELGGYISKAWQWQDIEAANVFNDAVFRGIQNTLVWKGMADSPFFADNLLGLFFHTFTGWGYAATNRYLIPSLQHPDASLAIKMLWMAGAGSLVSPMRRIARGEQPWPDDMTEAQISYEAFSDSGVFSSVANVLNIANFLSDDKLLGDLKNDKFRHRARTGIFGMSDIVSSTASRISDVLGMVNSGLDEKDLKTAAHMLPITGSMYGHYIGDKMIESWDLPANKRAAQ